MDDAGKDDLKLSEVVFTSFFEHLYIPIKVIKN